MSYADQEFVRNAKLILEHGTSTEGQEVRPHWSDGTPAYTIKQFGAVSRYDLRKEFPAITLRKVPIKSSTEEVLWIWQKKSNKVSDLSTHVWDQWTDKDGTIGKAYGYQAGKVFVFKKRPENMDTLEFVEKEKKKIVGLPSARFDYRGNLLLDQMDSVLYQLKYEPFSRRIKMSLWNVDELAEMNLQPCCWSVTFNVTDEKRPDGKLTLNMILDQRSNDMLAANGWNVCEYAVFHMMVAQSTGMIAGEFIHIIADQHIYDRHISLVKELIERKQYPAPKVWLDPEVTDFYAFTKDNVHVEDYVTGEQMTFEVAI